MQRPRQELLNRCYHVLMRCDEFTSQDRLRAIFTASEELDPFAGELKEASTLLERVQLNVAYMLGAEAKDGRCVFIVFLDALYRLIPEGKALRSEVYALRAEFEKISVDRISVPYVVAAMTRQEAESLQSSRVFRDPAVASIERDRFNALLPLLLERWLEDYGTQRDEWKLHADHSSVIGAVLDGVFAQINLCLRQPQGLPVLEGISLSEAFFSPEQQGEAWEEIRQLGGLLVIDAISLFYPPVRKALKDSELLSNEHIAVLVLSPLDFHTAPVNQHITELVKQEMRAAYSRFEGLDHRYEMGIGDLCGIQRWLFTLFSKPEDIAEVIQQRKVDLNRRRIRGQGVPGRMPGVIFRQSEVER